MEKSGRAESFLPNLLIRKKLSLIIVQQGLIYCPSQEKLQKNPKSKAITRDKMGRKPKREQQSTSQMGSRKEQWHEP